MRGTVLFASCTLKSGSGSKSRVGNEPEKGCGPPIHSQVSPGQSLGMVRSEPQRKTLRKGVREVRRSFGTYCPVNGRNPVEIWTRVALRIISALKIPRVHTEILRPQLSVSFLQEKLM